MIPSAGTPIRLGEIARACFSPDDFEEKMRRVLGVRHAFAVNSGTTAFYLILRALKRLSRRGEVVLPAYTAPSLILPVQKAGLEYRLADISLDTFNMDISKAAGALGGDTLAVLCVHMFGLPMEMGKPEELGGAFVIEDAASSFGTKIGGRFSGTAADAGFISFNRGKNLSTAAGGFITTGNEALAAALRDETGGLASSGRMKRAGICLKAFGLSLAVRPWFYTVFRQALSGFRHTSLHEGFESFRYTRFQGALGCLLLKRSEEIFRGRKEKGAMLHEALRHEKGIRLPVLPEGCDIVFNQFPLLVEDPKKRMAVLRAVEKAGLEATILYDRPIHKIYGGPQGYPNAEYMAERLVLIPVHHYVTPGSLGRAVEAVRRALRS